MSQESIPKAASSVAIAYHDELATGWDQRYRAGSFRRRAEFIVRDVLPFLSVKRHRCLDVGCGTGYFARILAKNGAEVLGIDGSANMILLAEKLSGHENLAERISFQTVDSVECLPFAEEAFDHVISLSVLEYLCNPGRCLKEMSRVLKPGGNLLISVPNKSSAIRRGQRLLRRFIDRRPHSSIAYLESSLNSWDRRQLMTEAAAQGIIFQKILGFDPFLPTWAWRLFPPSMLFFIGQKVLPDTACDP